MVTQSVQAGEPHHHHDDVCISNMAKYCSTADKRIAELEAEVEAMKPVVEAAVEYVNTPDEMIDSCDYDRLEITVKAYKEKP